MGPAAVPIMIGLMVAATAASAYGIQQQAQAKSDAAKYESDIADRNQEIANQNAKDAIERGQIEERRQRLLTQQEIGKHVSDAAARGVLVNSGSELLRQEDLAASGEFDALTIRSNAAREALGFKRQAGGFSATSSLASSTASNAIAAGNIQTAGTVLSGASSVAGKWNSA